MSEQLDPKKIFNTLNASHHLVYEYELFTTPIAESWDLGGLFSTLSEATPKSYKDEDKFRKILELSTPKSIYSRKPSRLEDIVSANIPTFIKGNELNTEISRYAAWALMKYLGADTIIQQEYFLEDGNFTRPIDHLKSIVANVNKTVRIQWRVNVAQQENQIKSILGTFNRGIGKTDDRKSYFAGLHRDINRILYDEKPVFKIRQDNKMVKGASLADYMNYHLLYAYYIMLRKTVRDWNNSNTRQTYPKFVDIALENAAIARSNFKHGLMYDNFTELSISAVKSDRNKREIAFAKKYSMSH